MHKRIIAFAIAFVLLLVVIPATNAFADSTVTLREIPSDDPEYIKIVKESNGETITNGTAIFRVDFFPNDSWSGTPARTWYYKTINGYTILNDESYYVSSGYFVISDPLYKNDLGLPTTPLGTVRITEAQAPEGYLKSDFRLEGKVTQPSTGADAEFQWTTQADGTIRYEEETAYVNNAPIKGDLKIVKKDAYEDILLSGAGFRVLDTNGQTVAEGYTDINGELVFKDLLYGDYQYQEFRAPKGFTPDDSCYPFEIAENGVTVVKEQVNYRRPGTIQVKKQDANGKALDGASFLLEYSTDDGSTWAPVEYREESDGITRGGCTSPGLVDGQLTTGDDGIVTFEGLRADSKILYRLTETAAPEGMSLIGGHLYVGTLPVESNNINASDAEVFDSTAYVYTLYVTATDNALFRLPETGGKGLSLLPFVMLMAATPIAIIFINRKEEISE